MAHYLSARSSCVVALIACAGCLNDHTEEVRLADFVAELYVTGGNMVMLELADREVDPCPVLSTHATASLDGVAGEIDPGSFENPHGTQQCIPPRITFANPPARVEPSTIVVADSSETWTFIITQPFAPRTFEPLSHPTNQVTAGDTVRLQLSPTSGELANASAIGLRSGAVLFDLDEASGLVRSGPELSFVVPPLPAGNASIWLAADFTLAIARCDAPLGCHAQTQISDDWNVTIMP